MKNIANIKLALDMIESNPACWSQGSWHCESSHCLAGLAQVIQGILIDDEKAFEDGKEFYGFNDIEAEYYFNPTRTLDQLKTSKIDWLDSDGYGRDGLNTYGENRNKYDCYDEDEAPF